MQLELKTTVSIHPTAQLWGPLVSLLLSLKSHRSSFWSVLSGNHWSDAPQHRGLCVEGPGHNALGGPVRR